MKKHKYLLIVLSILAVLSLLAACSPAATEAPAEEEAPMEEEAPAAEESMEEEAASEPVTLTYLVYEDANFIAEQEAVVAAFQEKYPNITVEMESRPGGADGDNLVKTRLATGEMNDVFAYNSGSLFQALQPTETLLDITDQPFVDKIVDSFFPTVTADGKIYGVPWGGAVGGGILYNKKVYEDLGLSVPKTWDEFAANNEIIKEAGITPVIATYGDTWTSQLFVLADYYNVEQANPNFADDYTHNKAKYATTPGAMTGFEYLQEAYEKGWYQEDFATDTLETGVTMLATGQGAHYPMLTFLMGMFAGMFPENIGDIGFFAQPGMDAAKNGATIWVPQGVYIPNTTEHAEEAILFLEFLVSPEAIAASEAVVPPTGPYMLKDVSLPDDVMPAVQDVAAYIAAGNSGPALEFVSPIKGPALEQICVAVGSGQMTAEEGAAAYDKDVEKQAQQLGLPDW